MKHHKKSLILEFTSMLQSGWMSRRLLVYPLNTKLTIHPVKGYSVKYKTVKVIATLIAEALDNSSIKALNSTSHPF